MVSLEERLNYMENCLSQILVQLSLAEERYGNIENRVGAVEQELVKMNRSISLILAKLEERELAGPG